MAKKVLQIPVEETQLIWIKDSMKEMKIKKQPEFIRTVLSYLMESDISDLKNKMEKTRISAMLQEAESKAEEALKEKEHLEKQLEKLGV